MKYLASLIIAASLLVPAAAFASTSISLNGGSVTVSKGQPFVEPGFSAFSTNFGNVTAGVTSSGADTSNAGTVSVSYNYGPDISGDSASASRTVNITGGGGLQYCSGPLAPGWNTSFTDGGCGTAFTFGQQVLFGGISTPCPFFNGCVLPKQ